MNKTTLATIACAILAVTASGAGVFAMSDFGDDDGGIDWMPSNIEKWVSHKYEVADGLQEIVNANGGTYYLKDIFDQVCYSATTSQPVSVFVSESNKMDYWNKTTNQWETIKVDYPVYECVAVNGPAITTLFAVGNDINNNQAVFPNWMYWAHSLQWGVSIYMPPACFTCF